MDAILLEFLKIFKASFKPPEPDRGQHGTDWWVSGVWSEYMRKWLGVHYLVEFPLGEHRSFAAIWRKPVIGNQIQGRTDLALEWRWDSNKVADDKFPSRDFRKFLNADAKCGLVIVQTRADGKSGSEKADETVTSLIDRCKSYRQDSGSFAVIEIRRVLHREDCVNFLVYLRDLAGSSDQEIGSWPYPPRTS